MAGTLGDKLGALLFQLPPNLKKDLALFDAFLDELPPKVCAAFEFRHASWLDEEVFERLAARNLALCVADSEKLSTPVRVTADYAYFRLRDEGYTPDDIERWADTIARETAACRDVFVYFKHEEEGKGPEFARLLMTASRTASRPTSRYHGAMTEPFVIAKTAAGKDVAVPAGAGQPPRAGHRRDRHRQDRDAAGAGRSLSRSIGVPVFLADVKGDLSGVAAAGAMSPKLAERLKATGTRRAGVAREPGRCSGTCSASAAFRSAPRFPISARCCSGGCSA